MKGLAKIFVTIFGLALVGFVVLSTLFIRVHPWSYGVKENLVAGGVSESDARTGFAFRIPGVHKWHMIDRRTHFVTFSTVHRRNGIGTTREALEIRTKDGNLASYDLTITYKVIDGKANEIVRQGNAEKYRGLAVDAIEGTMREELAKLSSEEIFSTEQRLEVAAGALPALRVVLAKNFLEPEQVLIRAVRFQKSYEAKLQAKQLTYQELQLAQSQRLVEDERGKTESKSAEIEAAEKELRGDRDKELQIVRSENEVAIAGVRSEANVYDQQTRAESDAAYETSIANGNLAIAKAEALRNELRNKALDTVGGRIYLAQQAAENLEFESVTLNSNDPRVPSVIDIGEMVKLLVGEASGSR